MVKIIWTPTRGAAITFWRDSYTDASRLVRKLTKHGGTFEII